MIKKYFSFDVSSLCDFRVLFLQALSQPVLSDLGVLFTAGFGWMYLGLFCLLEVTRYAPD